MNTIARLSRENLKADLPTFGIGDTVRADLLIVEGDKERVQAFTGTVIARRGQGIAESVTLRRTTGGYGVERVLPLHSPRLAKLAVVKQGRVRRSKLYYLRDQQGKAAKVKDLR